MKKKILIAAAAAIVSCGGSSWVDPTTGTFSTQDSADIMSMISGAVSAVATSPGQQAPLQGSKALTQSTTLQCAVSGTVTVNTTVNSAICDSAGTSCNFDASVGLTLNDCRTQTLIGTDGLTAHVWGSETVSGSTVTSFDVHEVIQGGITIKRVSDGTTIGTCGINVEARVTYDGTTETVHVTGTVCKQAMAQ